jgi:hypothetical protein
MAQDEQRLLSEDGAYEAVHRGGEKRSAALEQQALVNEAQRAAEVQEAEKTDKKKAKKIAGVAWRGSERRGSTSQGAQSPGLQSARFSRTPSSTCIPPSAPRVMVWV